MEESLTRVSISREEFLLYMFHITRIILEEHPKADAKEIMSYLPQQLWEAFANSLRKELL